MEPIKNTLGSRLAHLRHQKGVTQEVLAAQFHIAKSTLSSYERNERNPDYDMLNQFASYFNVSLDYLINGEEFHPKA